MLSRFARSPSNVSENDDRHEARETLRSLQRAGALRALLDEMPGEALMAPKPIGKHCWRKDGYCIRSALVLKCSARASRSSPRLLVPGGITGEPGRGLAGE